MAEKESKFTTTVESLFKGMDSFISAKTVVGDVVTVNDTIIVPLVDVSFGVAAGAWEKTDKNSAGGLVRFVTGNVITGKHWRLSIRGRAFMMFWI